MQCSRKLVISNCIVPGRGYGNPLQYPCLGNPHGQKSLAGYSPWLKESDTIEQLSTMHCIEIMGSFVSDSTVTLGKATNDVQEYMTNPFPLLHTHLQLLKLWRIYRFLVFLTCYHRSVSLGHTFFSVESGVISNFSLPQRLAMTYVLNPLTKVMPLLMNLPSLNLFKNILDFDGIY